MQTVVPKAAPTAPETSPGSRRGQPRPDNEGLRDRRGTVALGAGPGLAAAFARGRGSGRHRGDLLEELAYNDAIDFMGELATRIEDHGTCFCFEPLGTADSDFINSVHDSIRIVDAVDHPALRVQLDAKALVENDEVNKAIFEAAAPYLVHFHANEPGLGILGSTGEVPHNLLGEYLSLIGYDGYVSIEQRMLSNNKPMEDLAKSISVLMKNYQSLQTSSYDNKTGHSGKI